MIETVKATRYVTPFREGGSMPGLMEADDDGLYVVKYRGAGQGTLALTSEIIAAALAAELELAVPRVAFVDVDPALGIAEPDPEIQDLITASPGINLGSDFLPGATTYSPAGKFEVSPELAASIVWFDMLLTNVDRTAQNPNLLVWLDKLWLIDHGAALYLQHAGFDGTTQAAKPFAQISSHVLLPLAGSITGAGAKLSAKLDKSAIERAVGLVPQDWFTVSSPDQYVEYLAARLAESEAFSAEAENGR